VRRSFAPDLLRGADVLALAAITILPFALLHGRAVADALVCLVDLLFLLRCALLGAWSWTRHAWVRVAGGLWLWLLLSTVVEGSPHAVVQAAVSLRLLLFVAACEDWALRAPLARRLLALAITAAAAWIVLESWQQFLLGRNLFGAPRFFDGALTGPFVKPHAGPSYLAVLFPAVLPPTLHLLGRRDWTGRAGALLLLAGAAATMVLIGQRMPTLLMGLGLVFAALLLPRLRPAVLAALLLGVAVVAATPALSPPTYHKLVLHFAEQMRHFWLSNYGQIYLRAAEMLAASPLFGLGVEGFRNNCLDPAYGHGVSWLGISDAQLSATLGCNIHPHNYWLEMATSGGWPALLGFALLAGLWLAGLMRGLVPEAAPMRAALLVMLATLLWPVAASSSLFVVDAGGWVFVAAGWGLAEAASDRQAHAGA
jgi:hypothetical protein